MKKIILLVCLLCCVLISAMVRAQTIVFSENFETVDSMFSSGTPAWFQDSVFATNGTKCIRDTVDVNDTALLTSATFSTTGNFFVSLYFDHVCKLNFADRGHVEVSADNGNTWITLGANEYTGASSSFHTIGYFSSFSYGISTWAAGNDAALPLASWWRSEAFDLSGVAANTAQVKIRFRIVDGNGNGNQGDYGWLIDNVHVVAAPHELVPPAIHWKPPVLQNTVFFLGPFIIADTISDASGVASATLYYTVNGGAPIAVSMTNVSGSIWQGIIPAVSNHDTICYYVEATDSWGNVSQLPSSGCNTFIASTGITFPYSDDFEVNTTLWTPSSVSGSSWQLGMPNYGATNSTHSGNNAWDIDLNSGYLDNTDAELTSPVFNFIGVNNAVLAFWRNQNSETGWDGTRLEYTTNGSSWQILGSYGDTLGTNWYTTSSIGSSNEPAWDGASTGWTRSTYLLSAFNNTAGPVQFRFVFTSDVSINLDGFSLDDFSITPPSPHDVGVISILHPDLSDVQGDTDFVRVVIHNFGPDTTSGFPVSYKVNGASPVTMMHPGVLQPGADDTVTFSPYFTVPPGAFTISAWTQSGADFDPFNDTTRKSVMGLLTFTLPYHDNFDTGRVAWYDSSITPGTRWQHGTPTYGLTTGTHSGPSCWDINLTTGYESLAESYLLSPVFNMTGITNARLSFWQNRYSEQYFDGTRLDYSINAGQTWNVLGVANDPGAVNWYTYFYLFSTTLPGWDSASLSSPGTGGWQQSIYLQLPSNITGPSVRFRFVFTSDTIVNYDGISIDDFELYDPAAGMSELIPHSAYNSLIYPDPSAGIFHLRNTSVTASPVTVSVYDVKGNSIVDPFLVTEEAVIDLSGKPDGIYIVKCKTALGVSVSRIILMK